MPATSKGFLLEHLRYFLLRRLDQRRLENLNLHDQRPILESGSSEQPAAPIWLTALAVLS
jgi:hypothetical protein